jgi:hypothetical protein
MPSRCGKLTSCAVLFFVIIRTEVVLASVYCLLDGLEIYA